MLAAGVAEGGSEATLASLLGVLGAREKLLVIGEQSWESTEALGVIELLVALVGRAVSWCEDGCCMGFVWVAIGFWDEAEEMAGFAEGLQGSMSVGKPRGCQAKVWAVGRWSPKSLVAGKMRLVAVRVE